MADLSIPNSFTNGTVINADDVNENFTAVQTNSNQIWDILDGTTPFSANLEMDKTSPILTLDSDINDTCTYRLQENGLDRGYLRYLGSSNYAEVYNEVPDNYVRLLDTGEIKLESKNSQDITLTSAGNINISANSLEMAGTIALDASRNATLGTIAGSTLALTGNATIAKATPQLHLDADTGTSPAIIFKENAVQMGVMNYNAAINAVVIDNSTTNNTLVLADDGSITLDSQSSQDINLTPAGNVNITANDLEMSGTSRLRANGTFAPPTLAEGVGVANNSVFVNSSQSNKLYYKDDGGAYVDLESGGGGSESTSASNVGGATGQVFKQITGADLEFKTFSAGTGINITNGASTITITNTGGGPAFSDADFVIQDNDDTTKQAKFQASGIATGTTRTLTIQNKDYTIADNADLATKANLSGAIFTGNLTIDKAAATFILDSDTDTSPVLSLRENGVQMAVLNYNTASNCSVWDNSTANNSIILFDDGKVTVDSQSSQDIEFTPSGNVNISANDLEMGGTSVLTNARVLQNITQATIDNIGLNGNTISTSSGDLTLTPTTNVDISAGSLEMAGLAVLRTNGTYAPPTIAAASAANNSIFVNSSDSNKLYYKDEGGFSIDLESGGGSTSFADDIFDVHDNADATKIIKLQASGITTGNTRTLTVLDKSYTIGDALLSGSTFTGNITVDKATAQLLLDADTDTSPAVLFKENGVQMSVINYNTTSNGAVWDNSTANNSIILFDTGKITLDSQSTQDIELTPAGNVNITANSLEMAGAEVLRTNATYIPPTLADGSAANTSLYYSSTGSALSFKDSGGTVHNLQAAGTNEFTDDVFRIKDNSDATKKIAFQASGITTATTRTLTALNKDYTIGDALLSGSTFTGDVEIDKANAKLILDSDTDTDPILEFQENNTAKARLQYYTASDATLFSDVTSNAYIATFASGRIEHKAQGGDYVYVSNSGLVVGSPTGGHKGTGTINATAVYDDNVLLTDYVFEKHYLGKPLEERYRDYEMKSLDETIEYTKEYYHLPTMISREEWKKEGKPSIGKVVTQLWETVETQFLYIKELQERINKLEGVTR